MRAKEIFESLPYGQKEPIETELDDVVIKIVELEKEISDLTTKSSQLSNPCKMQIAKLTAQKTQLYAENRNRLDQDLKDLPKILNILKKIQHDCNEFICSTEFHMYRGVKNTNSTAFKGRSRDSRSVRDSSEYISAMFNEALRILGCEARRDNSIFL